MQKASLCSQYSWTSSLECGCLSLSLEIHLLSVNRDKEAIQGTKSKLVLAQLAEAVTTAVMELHKLHYRPRITPGTLVLPLAARPHLSLLPLIIPRASHTNRIQTEDRYTLCYHTSTMARRQPLVPVLRFPKRASQADASAEGWV